LATDDVPARTATAKGSARPAAARNSPPSANDKDAPAPATANVLPTPVIDNILPAPGAGRLSPSQEAAGNYDGFTVGTEVGEETGQPGPIRPRPAKHRQKPNIAERSSGIQPLDDQSEVERLKPKLTICRGC
jgi:hypothetical protein